MCVDEVVFMGMSHGGLSEVPESDYINCSMGTTFAVGIGPFGYRPSVLNNMLVGKDANIDIDIGPYMRKFFGRCSPSDLETALQLVYRLFTTNVQPGEKIVTVIRHEETNLRALDRDPMTALLNKAREINDGNCYFYRPRKIEDLRKVDPGKACEYFSKCFTDPSTFFVAIVGKIAPGIALPLILQYLGGIPQPPVQLLKYNPEKLREVPIAFPTTVVKEAVYVLMKEEQSSILLSFPIELQNEKDVHYLAFFKYLLENKILEILRFREGQVYSAEASTFLGGSKLSPSGYISLSFSCLPEDSSSLADEVLRIISCLQEEGPSDEDVSSFLEIEKRTYETNSKDNEFWLDTMLRSYGYEFIGYIGDFDTSVKAQEEARSTFRGDLTPLAARDALGRIIPCIERYTVVTLMPACCS